jgi:hypothetical protein
MGGTSGPENDSSLYALQIKARGSESIGPRIRAPARPGLGFMTVAVSARVLDKPSRLCSSEGHGSTSEHVGTGLARQSCLPDSSNSWESARFVSRPWIAETRADAGDVAGRPELPGSGAAAQSEGARLRGHGLPRPAGLEISQPGLDR